jgi:hypothetical protein
MGLFNPEYFTLYTLSQTQQQSRFRVDRQKLLPMVFTTLCLLSSSKIDGKQA